MSWASGVRFTEGAGNFPLRHRAQNISGAQPASYIIGTWRGRSVNLTTHIHLAPRSIMRGAIPPLPQYFYMAWCLVKHRDNFTFTFTYFS